MNINGKPFRTIWISVDNPEVIRIIGQHALPHALVIEEIATVANIATINHEPC
jgi:hypothetical protein